MDENEVTASEALTLIAETEGGREALKLVGDLMEHNTRSTIWAFEQAYEGEKISHEHTRERLREAHEQLDRIQRRLAWLAGRT